MSESARHILRTRSYLSTSASLKISMGFVGFQYGGKVALNFASFSSEHLASLPPISFNALVAITPTPTALVMIMSLGPLGRCLASRTPAALKRSAADLT